METVLLYLTSHLITIYSLNHHYSSLIFLPSYIYCARQIQAPELILPSKMLPFCIKTLTVEVKATLNNVALSIKKKSYSLSVLDYYELIDLVIF